MTGVLLVSALLAAPAGLVFASRAVSRSLGPVLDDPVIARGLVIGASIPAAAAGVVLALALDGPRALGAQVAAAPLSRRALMLASDGVTAALFALFAVPLLLALVVPLAGRSPGGAGGVAALVAVAGASLATGGAVAEATRSAWRGSHLAVAGLGAVLAVLVGLSRGGEPTDPLGRAADALAGRGGARTAIGAAVIVACVALACWGMLASSRPAPRSRRPGRSARIPSRVGAATWRGACCILVRRDDLRAAALAALALGCGGVILSHVTRAAAPSGTILAVSTAMLAAAPFSLAVAGSLAEGASIWSTAPVRRGVTAFSWAVASVSLVGPLAVVVGTFGALFEHVGATTLAALAALVVTTWLAGLLAGVLSPWRARRADQALSFGAFLVVYGATSGLGAVLGPSLVRGGLPAPLAAVVLLAGLAAVTMLLLARTCRGCTG